jgi:archaellum component FlaD/FlaE
MSIQTAPLLADVLETYCNANWVSHEMIQKLMQFLNHPDFPDRNNQFQRELADAILNGTTTPEEYEHLTDISYDEPEDIERELRELWQNIYGDKPLIQA